MDLTFLNASVPLQLALGAGYLGYVTAYAGLRNHHQQIDVAFLTVAFGLVATMAAQFASPMLPAIWAFVASVGAAVFAGIFWRVIGRGAVRAAMRIGRVTYVDDDPSVFSTIFADRSHNVSQVLVGLEDGREFFCDDVSRFRNAAVAPFMIGLDGSVALYVTHVSRRLDDGTEIETVQTGVSDLKWGDNMTIVPANSVRQIDIRFQKKRT